MSLFKSFKKALGFPEDYSNDLGDISDLEDRDEDIAASEITEAVAEAETTPVPSDDLSNDDSSLHNLNQQIEELKKHNMTLEAEREQLLLENRYMADRIRGIMPENITPGQNSEPADKQLLDEIENLKNENEKLKAQLLDAPNVEEQEEYKRNIENKISKFENILNKKDAELKSLRLEKAELSQECKKLSSRVAIDDEKIDALEKKVAELHKTIKTNLFDHASEQDKLNKEIRRLSSMITDPGKPGKTPRKTKQKETLFAENEEENVTQADMLSIDELMDSTEWFTAPQPGPRIKDPEVTENFGYKETVKKRTTKNDDNQLTLF